MKLVSRVLATLLLLLTAVAPALAADDGNSTFYTNQNLGIKKRNPVDALNVNGSALFEAGNVVFSSSSPVTFNDLALVNNSLQIPTGSNAGFVLTSDATGIATWQDLASLPANGDNLGDHTATTDLDLVNNDINNVDRITANEFVGGTFNGTFIGDGSGLTGISASNGTFNHITVNNGVVNNTTINNPLVNNAYLQDPTINGTATFTANSQTIINGGLRFTVAPAPGFVLTTDALGNASWVDPTSVVTAGDNLGDHTATQDLDMAGNDIINASTVAIGTNSTAGADLYVGSLSGNGTRVFAEVPVIGGFADYVTVDESQNRKWATGSTGDARDDNNGGRNTFYIFQHTDQSDNDVNEYRLSITDAGQVGIDLHNPTATLDVAGGTKDFIDGVDDLLVKDDVEVDGDLYATRLFGDGSGLTGVDPSNGTINNITVNNGDLDNVTITNSLMKTSEIRNSDLYNVTMEMSEINNTVLNSVEANDMYLQDPTINGVATFEENSVAIFQGELMFTVNPGAGKILTSDSNGKAQWVPAGIVNTRGDNLGNHTAERELKMANFDISEVGTIDADFFEGGIFNGTFVGDGSGLTGVESSIFRIVGNAIVNNGSAAGFDKDFIIGSPTTGNPGNPGQNKRLFFDKSKGAFRAGGVLQNQWNNVKVGDFSAAFGRNTIAEGFASIAGGNGSVARGFGSLALGNMSTAEGPHSMAFGYRNYAPGNFALAFGNNNAAAGHRSTAFGYKTRAIGQGATTFGRETVASGNTSFAIGQEAIATKTNSFAIGKNVRASGDQSFTIGLGNSNQDVLANNINNSLAVGFNSNAATLFVRSAAGGSTTGKVGIGTNVFHPDAKLDVKGKTVTEEFRMPTGAAPDLVLTSVDAGGNGVWKSIGEIAGSGDNFGNHIATQDIDMAGNRINNLGGIDLGIDDLNDGVSDNHNLFLGFSSGANAEAQKHNTAVGNYALRGVTSGGSNVAIGRSSAISLKTGSRNIAIGHEALGINEAGNDNIAIGHNALASYLGGFGTEANIAIGSNAGGNNIPTQSISQNVLIGRNSGKSLNNASGNVFLGNFTGQDLADNDRYNTLIGHQAGMKMYDSTRTIAIGTKVLSDTSGGSGTSEARDSVYIGYNIKDHTSYYARYDINGDNRINSSDANIIIACLGRNNCDPAIHDMDGDGSVSSIDALLVTSYPNKPKNALNKIVIGSNIDASLMPNNTLNIGDRIFTVPGSGAVGATDYKVRIGKPKDKLDFEATGWSRLGGGASIIDTLQLWLPGRGVGKVLVDTDGRGKAEWKDLASLGGASDNLGNHKATQDLNMRNFRVVNASKVSIGPTVGPGQLYVGNTNATANASRVFARINRNVGWADYGTADEANNIKWIFGSYGDSRGNGNGGPNSFFIGQKTDKNDQAIPTGQVHRLHINDAGNVGIGTTSQTEKLEVAGKVKATCLILNDGTEVCNKRDIINLVAKETEWRTGNWSACSNAGTQTRNVTCRNTAIGVDVHDSKCVAANKPAESRDCTPPGPSDNNGCGADGFYHVTGGETLSGGSNKGYGTASFSRANFAQCEKVYYRDTGHSLTRTWNFLSPPRSGNVVFRWYRDRTGESTGSGIWYWLNGAKITVTNLNPTPTHAGGRSIHEGRKNGLNELRCNYNKGNDRFTCTYHRL